VPNAEELIEEALVAAGDQGVAGQDVTPFVLSFLQERSNGRALAVNRDLILANAALAAEVAVAFAAS
jgi:pseudouridine-5'-phosphate glycosidase